MTAPSLLVPMRLEAAALARTVPAQRILRTGMGPRSGPRAVQLLRDVPGPALLTGLTGALAPGLEPGDVVLATEVHAADGRRLTCPDPTLLAAGLRDAGLRVHMGALASRATVIRGAARARLAATGAIAVDMESAWVLDALAPRPVHVLRVVLDSPERELHHLRKTLAGLHRALASLSRVGAQLERLGTLLEDRELVLAAPRASCAGVERAIDIVAAVLADRGAPVYVRKQIVHNAHVVAELEARGAVFVDELDEVPAGATVIFSAHGVSPAVREAARARELKVIDATCPLVAKVHAEARRFASAGHQIVLIGHAGHEEIDGTIGEAPERIQIIAQPEEVQQLEVDDPGHVAYLTQTTLAIDETADVIAALRARFPAVSAPASSDICYATQNRQDAVRALAEECDLMLVVGSANSSNSNRLVEVARRSGVRAELVEDATQVRPHWLTGVRRVGLSAGASAPESLVQGVIDALAGLGALTVSEHTVAREELHFKLPPEVRSPEEITCPSR